MGCRLASKRCPRQRGQVLDQGCPTFPAEVTQNGPSLWMSFHITLLGRGFNSRHLHQFNIQQHPKTSNKTNQDKELNQILVQFGPVWFVEIRGQLGCCPWELPPCL